MFEQLSNPWWMFVILGLLGGVLSGALGVGSGVVFVPLLASVFLLPQKSAQGTALAVMAPMALLGAVRYWRNPEIDINLAMVGLIVVGALAGVLIGTMIVQRVPGHWLRKAFAVFLVVVAVRMLMMPNKPGPSQPDKLNNNPADVLKVKGSSDG
ncbi:MAG: sulfite exporter TauE/SafE family protein [Phycisphaerales bacterium]|nr:sulfite exporter TauE/SafE family protein [Phycisphaerales bacterium]